MIRLSSSFSAKPTKVDLARRLHAEPELQEQRYASEDAVLLRVKFGQADDMASSGCII